MSYGPTVGDRLAHLAGQGLGELRVELSESLIAANARRRATKAAMAKLHGQMASRLDPFEAVRQTALHRRGMTPGRARGPRPTIRT